MALELPEKTAIRRSSSSKLVNVPSAERVAHLRRLSNFLPATVRTPRSYRRTGSRAAGVPTTNVSNARARKKKSQSLDSRTGNPIWADDESDEDDNDTRNADCLGGRPQSKRSKFQQGGQPTRRDSDSRSESANNSVASSSHLRKVSSIPEVDDDPHPDPLNKDELSMNFDDAKDIEARAPRRAQLRGADCAICALEQAFDVTAFIEHNLFRGRYPRQPRHVRLTPTQVTIAKKLGVPLEEYAKQLIITKEV